MARLPGSVIGDDGEWRSRPRRAWRFQLERGPRELWRAVRRNGVSGCANFLARQARYMLGDWVGSRFDRRYGVDTRGEIARDRLDVVGDNAPGGTDFMSVPPRSFFQTLRDLPEDLSAFAFVDYGCGKGRALLLAGMRNFRRIIGVEHSPALAAVANRNIAQWRGPRRCSEIRAVCADATVFEPPEEPCVLYFNGPFDDHAVLAAVLARIDASFRARPRPLYAVYLEAVVAPLPDAAMLAAGFRRRAAPRRLRFDPGAVRHANWYAVYERLPA
jgi:SAM-dependent methyltransferase